MKCCDMKGYLSYLILWILKRKNMNGAEIAKELETRRGKKPSPGTIYPALKELKEKRLVAYDKNKVYSLTKKGKKELNVACSHFCRMFYDINEMFNCCKKITKKGKKIRDGRIINTAYENSEKSKVHGMWKEI